MRKQSVYTGYMITDLVQIKRLGEQARAENEKFRRFMKTHAVNDKKFRHIADEIEGKIDCMECANCCRVATVELQERDIEKLAKFFRLSISKFMKQYTTVSEEEGVILQRTEEQGCVFLSGNECTVYEARPSTCVDFPHVVRGRGSLQSRMWQFIDRAVYCPIVYNSLEAFKDESKFRK